MTKYRTAFSDDDGMAGKIDSRTYDNLKVKYNEKIRNCLLVKKNTLCPTPSDSYFFLGRPN